MDEPICLVLNSLNSEFFAVYVTCGSEIKCQEFLYFAERNVAVSSKDLWLSRNFHVVSCKWVIIFKHCQIDIKEYYR